MKSLLRNIVLSIITLEAKLVLKKYKPKIIAITGSVGKTGTKDAIYEVVQTTSFVRKSEKSYNSDIGVPLTILGCQTGWGSVFVWIKNILEGVALIVLKNHYPKVLVLEVGMNHPGEIAGIAKWLKPDIVVFTQIGDVPVHVEFFDSPGALLAEKATLLKALKKGGVAILNKDDERVMSLCSIVKEREGKLYSYGFSEGADMRGIHPGFSYAKGAPSGTTFKVQHDGKILPVKLCGILGAHYGYGALASLLVGLEFGVNALASIEAIGELTQPPGRSRIIPALKGAIIIDDTYNASPIAMQAALSALELVDIKGRKIAVLGDMLELGKYSINAHKEIGKLAGEVCDMLIVVGPRAEYIAEGALIGGLSEKKIFQFSDVTRAGNYLQHLLKEGDVVLVKGSQGMRMERIVLEVMAHPEDCEKLLVRQEKVWQNK